jgi:hypothetical protein
MEHTLRLLPSPTEPAEVLHHPPTPEKDEDSAGEEEAEFQELEGAIENQESLNKRSHLRIIK